MNFYRIAVGVTAFGMLLCAASHDVFGVLLNAWAGAVNMTYLQRAQKLP